MYKTGVRGHTAHKHDFLRGAVAWLELKTMGTKGILDYGGRRLTISADTRAEKAYRLTSCKREPLTVEWIETMPEKCCFWDIGANVGAYSLIAAAQDHCDMVVSCEPHWGNFNHLTSNIILNEMQEKILPLCVSLHRKRQVESLYHREVDAYGFMEAGSSGHQIGKPISGAGAIFTPSGTTKSLALELDSLVDLHRSDHNYLKIDVDGVESEILNGASSSLAGHVFDSILVEVNRERGVVADLLRSHKYNFLAHGDGDNEIWSR